jgi:hypothetical protein
MLAPNIIEELLERELKSLCINCADFGCCALRKQTSKVIIQCELYRCQETAKHSSPLIQKGLCVDCAHAIPCSLPAKNTGVWHCEQYE